MRGSLKVIVWSHSHSLFNNERKRRSKPIYQHTFCFHFHSSQSFVVHDSVPTQLEPNSNHLHVFLYFTLEKDCLNTAFRVYRACGKCPTWKRLAGYYNWFACRINTYLLLIKIVPVHTLNQFSTRFWI